MGILLSLWSFVKTPLGQKIAIIVICASLAWGALAWYGHRREEIGKAKGIVIATEDIRKQKETEWKQRDLDLQKREGISATNEKVAQAKTAELLRLRLNLDSTLAQIRAASRASQEASNEIIDHIPAAELNDSIIRKSTELGPPKEDSPAN